MTGTFVRYPKDTWADEAGRAVLLPLRGQDAACCCATRGALHLREMRVNAGHPADDRTIKAPAMSKPTPAMRRALQALASDAEGKLAIADFYRAMNVTNRGRYLVFSRMADRDWIERTSNHGSAYISITPWGREALAH